MPDASYQRGEVVGLNGSDLLLFLPAEPCIRCGVPTVFIEVNFEARLHDECASAMWDEFDEANRRMGPPDPPGFDQPSDGSGSQA